MKKYIVILLILTTTFCVIPTKESHAVIWVVVKAALKKVIKAMDLQVQRLQNKTIGLQNIQKALENKLSKLRLDEISTWTEKQKKLYQDYFSELWKVKSAITYYQRIRDIIEKQKQLVEEYKHAYALLRQDKHFSQTEIDQIYTMYSGIISESLKSINDIFLVINSFSLQMSDGQRLEIIAEVAGKIDEYVADLRRFTQRNIAISFQRAKSTEDIYLLEALYGVQKQ
ncbi:conjugal transfer protein TraI [Chitinophaga varians]|uniref:conjugal transfer protein TraI n=1 Tax=Chitinophaga varians TaxID=2202339 RepID=UPI0016600337|nr:conjugal transfer protein TraI [Chitinophaga varians]MBC9909118.1 conjugal transfer protein TraI [Chitinophaga varians]